MNNNKYDGFFFFSFLLTVIMLGAIVIAHSIVKGRLCDIIYTVELTDEQITIAAGEGCDLSTLLESN